MRFLIENYTVVEDELTINQNQLKNDSNDDDEFINETNLGDDDFLSNSESNGLNGSEYLPDEKSSPNKRKVSNNEAKHNERKMKRPKKNEMDYLAKTDEVLLESIEKIKDNMRIESENSKTSKELIENIDMKLDSVLINQHKSLQNENFNFVISLLDLLDLINDSKKLAALKAEIYSLISKKINDWN